MTAGNKALPLRSLIALAGLLAALPGGSDAATGADQGHLGLVLEGAFEAGGDNVAKVFYANGDTQNIRAGQGGTLSIGAHYQLADSPLDFMATVGYKFIRTADYHTDLGIDRVVFKFVGSWALGNGWWINAGPVLHTDTRFNGDGFVPDIRFDDAVGGTVGFGWRWIGLTYTNIQYHSPITGSLDASNGGISFTWKF